MGYTVNQQKAIDISIREILVSAAAGSGKTSVLVERIIKRIMDTDKPVDIDRLLIVTFTKAAAKEMRERIRRSIEDALDASPEDDNLLRQSVLVHNAQITTIHGFCQSIIRDHFEELDIDPNFRVGDDNECKLLAADVLDEVLEEFYTEGADDFLEAVEQFGSSKSDASLADAVMSLYRYSQSHPDPDDFLDRCVEAYNVNTVEELEGASYFKDYIASKLDYIRGLLNACKKGQEVIGENDFLGNYMYNFEEDEKVFASLLKCSSYGELSERLAAVSFTKLNTIKKKDLGEGDILGEREKLLNDVKKIRETYKKDLTALASTLSFTLKEMLANMQGARGSVNVLATLVKSFAKAYADKKRDKNIIDFNDMEHMAIAILSGNDSICQDYRDYFEEIYVDEYQDSNMTQEALIGMIMKKEPCGNVFMVGDVKQSIYRFRQARPDLFVNKYDRFTDEDSMQQRIILNDNFRSRPQVLGAVNEVFASIMKKDFGGIEYDENASLKYGAKYYEDADAAYEGVAADVGTYKAELLIGTGENIPAFECEAAIISDRIVKMISEKMPVYDAKDRKVRPISYRDIVILVRSLNGVEGTIKKALEEAGVPVALDSSVGYFMTLEVSTILAFLTVVDNPLNDIELATVMRSVLGGFDNEELALLRVDNKKEQLYTSVKRMAGEGLGDANIEGEATGGVPIGAVTDDANASGDDACVKAACDADKNMILREKCSKLLEKINYYRAKASYTTVYDIIREIVDSGYGDYVRGLDRGEQRIANLNMLMIKAEDYSKTSFSGLFNFVRYIELMKKYDIDDGEVGLLGDDDDVVRIMTIHKSKGLEFPVCFIAKMGKLRNRTDENSGIVWDATYGVGVDRVDIARRTKCSTIYKEVIKNHLKRENIAEEMRVLYVAMTRAREKLIMVAHSKKNELPAAKIDCSKIASMLDMVLMAGRGEGLYNNISVSLINEQDIIGNAVEGELTKETYRDELLGIVRDTKSSEAGDESTWEKLNYSYPYEDTREVPAKLSVSELKHKAIEDIIASGEELAPEGHRLFEETNPDTYIPKFMRQEGQTEAGGTFYGTAFHRILELWDYSKEQVEAGDVTAYVEKMLEKRRIDKQQADAIRPSDIAYFLNSDIGRRLYKAKQNGTLYREQPFGIGIAKSEVQDIFYGKTEDDSEVKAEVAMTDDGQELVLVQGIIDAFIIEEDGILILDYKTDNVDNEDTLKGRYREQLEWYKRALSQITGNSVTALVIYSSRLRKAIYL